MRVLNETRSSKEDREELDFYETPTFAITPLLQRETFSKYVLEPCAGDGAIARVLRSRLPNTVVFTNDIVQRNFPLERVSNFLHWDPSPSKCLFDSNWDVVTNPPFDFAVPFYEKCRDLGVRKFAFLLRLGFLEGDDRYHKVYNSAIKVPLKSVYVFSRRITFKNQSGLKSGKIAFSWFVWDRDHVGPPTIDWIYVKE